MSSPHTIDSWNSRWPKTLYLDWSFSQWICENWHLWRLHVSFLWWLPPWTCVLSNRHLWTALKLLSSSTYITVNHMLMSLKNMTFFVPSKCHLWSPRLWGTYWRYWSKLQCRWVAQGGARRANFFIRQEYCYWSFKNIITKIPSLCAFKISKIPIKRVRIRWLTMGDASLNQLPAFTLRATRFTVFLNLISRW